MPDSLIDLRDTLNSTLAHLGGLYRNMVLVDAGFSTYVRTAKFSSQYQGRYLNVGLSEQDAISTALGLTVRGKIPVVCSLANFIAGRAFEQIRTQVCYPNVNIKIIGVNAGIGVGSDGPIYQGLNDLILTRSLPNMKVFCPADSLECKQILQTMMADFGPAYIRLNFGLWPNIYRPDYRFGIGRGHILREGEKVVMFAIGSMVAKVLQAADLLKEQGILVTVVNLSSIKPIDKKLILRCAELAEVIFTVEDHTIIGGLGSAVAEVVSEHMPKKVCRLGIDDRFGESGTAEELYARFGLDAKGIAGEVIKFVKL